MLYSIMSINNDFVQGLGVIKFDEILMKSKHNDKISTFRIKKYTQKTRGKAESK